MTRSDEWYRELERHRFTFEGALSLMGNHVLTAHLEALTDNEKATVQKFKDGCDQGSWIMVDEVHSAAHRREAVRPPVLVAGESRVTTSDGLVVLGFGPDGVRVQLACDTAMISWSDWEFITATYGKRRRRSAPSGLTS